MKVLVTGAAGQVGSIVAREFLDAGHEVRILDIAPPSRELRERCEVHLCDLQDRLGLFRAVEGCDAVAHLAAIPNPAHGNDRVLFGPNVLGTQLLLAAAEAYEIKRFALASSCSIYGFPFQQGRWDENTLRPQYLPMDIHHPIVSQDVYALSKECNEITAAMYSRRCDMATTCLRLTWVVSFESRRARRWIPHSAQHAKERPSRDLWAYVEARDVARAFMLALEKFETGHRRYVLAAQDVLADVENRRELIERHYSELAPFLSNGFDYDTYGFWDSRPAQEELGWNSRFHWREFVASLENQTP